MINPRDYYSVPEFAKRLLVNEETVRRHIRIGRLRAERIGNQWFIRREDLRIFAAIQNRDIVVARGLTNREKQVALLTTQGYSNKEVSKILGLNPGTVATHIASIFIKLRISRRTQIRESLTGKLIADVK